MSQFEILANELIFDIFEFLNTSHLIHAFLPLNSRFKYLLYEYFQQHSLDLRSISRYYFHEFCKEHLPNLTNNITSLQLSNNGETPNLCELLYSYEFPIDRFIQLRSLVLYEIDSSEVLCQIINQCQNLSSFDHLYLFDCKFNNKQVAFIIGQIWCLPNLTHFVMNNLSVDFTSIRERLIISSMLKSLSLKNVRFNNESNYLLDSIPCLEYLKIDSADWLHLKDRPKKILSSLTSLQISIDRCDNINQIDNLFRTFPNLIRLTLRISFMYLDGNVCKKLINDNLPNLQTFRLKTSFECPKNVNVHETADQLIDSFRTEFWLVEHKWYVRCDYDDIYNRLILLYTLPNVFDIDIEHRLKTKFWLSTKPDESKLCPLLKIHDFQLKPNHISSLKTLEDVNNMFPNLKQLITELPYGDDTINRYTMIFSRLTTLNVSLENNFGYDQLQIILNRTHCLYSLIIDSFGETYVKLFQLTSPSVRRIQLLKAQAKFGKYFNHDDCEKLVNSPLGFQCQVLSIELEDQMDIIYLIEKIPHLRVLVFRIQLIVENHLRSPSIQNKFIRWLQGKLSTRSIIKSYPGQASKLKIWIDREANNALVRNRFNFSSILALFQRFF